MKPSRFVRRLVLPSLLLATQAAMGAGIQKLYTDALSYDAQFAAARSAHDAATTLPGQALGQLLPQLSANGSRIKNDTETESTITHNKRDYDIVSRNASLNLSLALIRPQLWWGYSQSRAQLKQADAEFAFATHELMIRVTQAYFDALLAEDSLQFVIEQKAAIAQQLNQAKQYYAAGVGTITDVNEAQARHDTVVAQQLMAENNLEVRIRALEQIVGSEQRALSRVGDRLALDSPEPADVEHWIEVALEKNPQVHAALHKLEASEKEVHRSIAGHLPTVDLVASKNIQRDPGYTTLDQRIRSDTLGIQVSIPLFSGGTTQGRVNQNIAMRERARNEYEHARRTVVLQTRQQYLNIMSGVARVRALEQAVKSNELALYSARKGMEAGLRTSFDILNAQQLLFSAKRDLAQAKYDYIMSRLRLRSAAGLLNEDDIQLVQGWLEP